MLAVSLLKWWYGQGWLEAARQLKVKIKRTLLWFSAPQLLRTLFKPWRQTIDPKDPNANIGLNFNRWLGNLISRIVGFWVRLLTISMAGLTAGLVGLVGLAALVAWPLVPLLIIGLLFKGIELV